MNMHIITATFNGQRTRLVVGCEDVANELATRAVLCTESGTVVLSRGEPPERDEAEKLRARQLTELLMADQTSEDLD